MTLGASSGTVRFSGSLPGVGYSGICLVILLLSFFSEAVFGQIPAASFAIGPPPAWVETVAIPPTATPNPNEVSDGQVVALMDTQVNVAKSETFVRVVKDITSNAGLQAGANLTFSWDPSYQDLTIHEVTIERGTNRIDRLDRSNFKIIQREPDLESQIYDGTLSAVLFLDDVRVGDRIEFEYTLRGRNPTLAGNYADRFILGFSVPIERRRVRLLWPTGRPLNYQVHGMAAEPRIRVLGGVRDYLWDLQNVPAVLLEDQLPTWFSPYPWLEVSGYTNWSQITEWASGLFVTTNQDAPELERQARSLEKADSTDDQKIQGVLDFVQNDIRYLGIEFGPNSYHPTDPLTVLQQRYGDCKDKALLFCTLLHDLGFEATPVLVSTLSRQTLPNLLPAPGDFDHVIVCVVADGKTFWLDPTQEFQHGPVNQLYLPDYAFGLPVVLGQSKLVPIPPPNADATETDTSEVFHVGGQKMPAALRVTSTFKGFDAEWMRAVLAADGRDALARAFLNDYAARYAGIAPVTPMEVDDSPNSDTIAITDRYLITNFWVLSADRQRYTCQFYPLNVHTWIARPVASVRSMPMAISFPRRCRVNTEIELPIKFPVTKVDKLIQDSSAELRIQRKSNGRVVWLDYDYRSRTNFIPVADVAGHLQTLDDMEDALGFSLKWQSMDSIGKTSQFNWPVFLLASIYSMVFAGAAGVLCYRQCWKSPGPAANVPPPLPGQNLSGLGGWLILVGIGLVLKPVFVIASIGRSLGNFSLWKWHGLTEPGGVSYNPLWGPVLTFELLGQISLALLTLILLVLFFQKRRIFPRWFIGLMILNAVFVFADMLGVHFLGYSTDASMAIRTRNITNVIFGCGIWIPYMLVSKRVKATFVR